MGGEFGIQIDDGTELMLDEALHTSEKVVQLYTWQQEAVEFFLKHKHSIFEVTTGAGKTYCTIYIIKTLLKKHPKMRVLIVVPKNVILEDTWYKELWDAGINLQNIGIYYGLGKEEAQITLTNMQSIGTLVLEKYDFIILDEVHHYGTPRMLKYVSVKCPYKLGLSATVERMDMKHWKIMEIFKYNVFKYSPGKALQDGILNPFDFTNIGIHLDPVTRERYKVLTEEINMMMQAGGGFTNIMKKNSPLKYKMLSKMNDRKQLVNNYYKKFDVVKKLCLKHKDNKVLVFSQFNKQTNKTYWELLDVGVMAKVMHSGISKDERDKTLIEFRQNKFNVLLTSKVLDEGYNLPSIDTAIITAGDSTAKQTIQRMGRVLRKKETRSNLYQVYCINTIEEEYGEERAKLFKQLCYNYNEEIVK